MAWEGFFNPIGVGLFGDRDQQLRELLRRDTYNTEGSLKALQAAAAAKPSETVSAEMLRQGLAQNVAAQNSMAAGAPASQQAMARRMAMQQAGKLGGQLAGQQALAAMVEKQRAMQALADMRMGLRGQDLGMWQQRRQEQTGAQQGSDVMGSLGALLGLV